MMLNYLGEQDGADRVNKAVRGLQADSGYWNKPWSTASVGDAVAERL
jgi:isocitrate/isopropylmalate dehydrogenase